MLLIAIFKQTWSPFARQFKTVKLLNIQAHPNEALCMKICISGKMNRDVIFLHLLMVCMHMACGCVCVFLCVCMFMTLNKYDGQRLTFYNWLSPPNVWTPWIKLRSSFWVTVLSVLYQWSHLTHSRYIIFKRFLFWGTLILTNPTLFVK